MRRTLLAATAVIATGALWVWHDAAQTDAFPSTQLAALPVTAPPSRGAARRDAITETLRRAASAPGGRRPEGFNERTDDEAISAVALEQHRIATDPTLSDDERFTQFVALEAQLPDALRAARGATSVPGRLAEEEAALRSAGGSDEDIRALRERILGSEAADRLAALDQQRDEWQDRVDAYRRERAAIDQDTSASPDQRGVAIEALRARDFNGRELPRIRALDGMQSAAAAPPP